MFYERKVKYLDYYEGQDRIRGSGFVKLEVRDGILRLELVVTGLHHTDTYVRDVMLCGKGRERPAGRIEISGGRGEYRQQWNNLGDIGGTGIDYGELQGIRIPLGTGREIVCRWKERDDSVRADGDMGRRKKVREEPEEDPIQEQRDREVSESLAIAGQNGTGQDGPEDVGEDRKADGERPEAPGGQEESDAHSGGLGIVSGERESHGERFEMRAEERTWRDEGEEVDEKRMSGQRHGNAEGGMSDRIRGNDPKERPDKSWDTGEWETSMGIGKAVSTKGTGAKRTTARPEAGAAGAKESGGGGWSGAAKEKGLEEGAGRKEDQSLRERRGLEEGAGWKGGRSLKEERKQIRLMEDKWSQLWAIYPHIRPFQDSREYLSIGPSDFVLFSEEAYKMVNNSFLLHGYYNYRHLLLAKVERKGDSQYYIGVPGNFYEREKQVAIMFGFESFECAEEPAQAGDFGYYMMRTKI